MRQNRALLGFGLSGLPGRVLLRPIFDLGQRPFSTWAKFDLGQVRLGPSSTWAKFLFMRVRCVWWVRWVVCPKGGSPTFRDFSSPAPSVALFFSLGVFSCLFLSLEVFSWNFGGV